MSTEISSGLAKSSLVDKDGLLTIRWLTYFRNQQQQVNQGPTKNTSVSVSAQSDSIGTTAFPTDALAAGLYRVTWYLAVTTPATTSSSLALSLFWTEGGVSKTFVGTAETGNLNTTVQSGTFTMNVDASTPISYATTYSSVAANEMQYALALVLESL